jgi:leucyl/phenylalanyl-tRNA---protein transferase
MSRTIPQLTEVLWFPDPRHAAPVDSSVPGLVAVGGDLSIARLVLAYQSGIFPWSDYPVTWWSPDPRGILELHELHIPRSLRRVLRQKPFQLTFDCAFREVIEGCARPAPGREQSWISAGFIEAYTRLHQVGRAHSIECWREGELVGGLYGVAINGLFAGESMFQRHANASKIAVVHLVELLRQQGFELLDVQIVTPVTELLGARWIPRAEYLDRLRQALSISPAIEFADRERLVRGQPAGNR